MICNFMIRFYEPEALATAILYFNVYMNYHLSLALRVSLRVMEGGLPARRYFFTSRKRE